MSDWVAFVLFLIFPSKSIRPDWLWPSSLLYRFTVYPKPFVSLSSWPSGHHRTAEQDNMGSSLRLSVLSLHINYRQPPVC